MKEYQKKDDWKIIKHVQADLVRKYIDITKLKINSTRGNVEIGGMLEFTGQARGAMDSVMTISNALKNMNVGLRSISNLRTIKWKLQGWELRGQKWNYAPTSDIRKKNEAKGIK